jgi:CheY-like chemotaxis protein
MENVTVQGKGPRLLIADDHAIFAEALRVYLEKTHTVVGLVRDGRAMLAEAMRLRPDVIVVDVGMPLAGKSIYKPPPSSSFSLRCETTQILLPQL